MKINKYKILRVLIASLTIFLLFGAFGFYKLISDGINFNENLQKISTFFYNIITAGQVTPSLLSWHSGIFLSSFAVIILLILTALFGRFYCAVCCPMGIVQDVAAFVRHKIFRHKKNIKATRSHYFKYLKYLSFGAFFTGLFFGEVIFVAWLEPYSIFGRFLNGINPSFYQYHATGMVQYLDSGEALNVENFALSKIYNITIIASIVMFLLIFMSLMRRRFFCHNICPIGTLLGFFAKNPLFKLQIIPENCIQCKKCTVHCAGDNCLDIPNKKLNNSTCVMCMNCLNDCNSGAVTISLKRFAKNSRKPKKIKNVSDIDDKFTELNRRQFLTAIGCGIVVGGTGALFAKNSDKTRVESLVEKEIMPVMPPGAINLAEFKSKCIGCHRCVRACPSNVLQVSTFNYGGVSNMFLPYLDFDAGMCNDSCMECVKACPTKALEYLLPEKRKLLKIGTVKYNQNICVVETNHEACGACAEHCPTGAIEMVEFSDGLAIPNVQDEYCIGCGSCQNICPVLPLKALIVSGVAEQKIIPAKPERTTTKIVHEEEFPF